MIKAVIFDVGGVLFNHFIDGYGEEFEKKNHHLWQHWYECEVDEITEDEFWTKTSEKMKKDKNKFKEQCYSLHTPREDIIEIVKKLHKKYKLAIITNHLRDFFNHLIETYDFERYFDVIVTSFDERIKKPEPRIFEITLERLNLKPDECVFIDDKKGNIDAAQKIGIKGILFKDTDQLEKDLRGLGIDV